MDDLREKVIRELEKEVAEGSAPCKPKGYMFPFKLIEDALSLLKEQGPIEPIKHLSTGQICGSCKKVLLRKYKYCPACGKEVKWDE